MPRLACDDLLVRFASPLQSANTMCAAPLGLRVDLILLLWNGGGSGPYSSTKSQSRSFYGQDSPAKRASIYRIVQYPRTIDDAD